MTTVNEFMWAIVQAVAITLSTILTLILIFETGPPDALDIACKCIVGGSTNSCDACTQTGIPVLVDQATQTD